MYKSAIRVVPRRIITSRALRQSSKRCISTAPPSQKSRGWKSSAARWAVAAGGIYYYNTSNLFAEEPEAAIDRLEDSVHAIKESALPTVDAIVEEKRARQAQNIAEEQKREREARATLGDEQLDEEEDEGGIEGLEHEAGQQGAFNEETGEINWDCPCLGGMAHGPCGDEFKEAFSCFVFSKDEPKGIECIDKFKGMQNCFREHPEMYAAELADDEEDEELQEEIRSRDTSDSPDVPQEAGSTQTTSRSEKSKPSPATPVESPSESEKPYEPRTSSKDLESKSQEGLERHGETVPKPAHDASQ